MKQVKTTMTAAALGLVVVAATVVACRPAILVDDYRPSRPHVAATAGADPSPTPDAVERTTTEPGLTTVTSDRAGTTTTTTTPTTPTTPTTTVPPPPRPESPGGDIEHAWYGSGPTVAILGDSLTVQARQQLRHLLAEDYALKVGALYGEGMAGGPLSVGLGGPIMAAVVDEYAADPPDVAVIALGTNDVWQPMNDADDFAPAWHAATRRLAGACIVGVTVTETDQALRYDPIAARRVNRVIRRSADVVVDWAAEGPSPRYTAPDNIHLTEEGRRHFAALILDGIETCTEAD